MAMTEFAHAAALWLLLTGAIAMLRVLRGPSPADRMLTVQLWGTNGIALALLLGYSEGLSAAADVALVLAVLAVVALAAFVRRLWGAGGGDAGRERRP